MYRMYKKLEGLERKQVSIVFSSIAISTAASIIVSLIMPTLGDRLRSERMRFKLNQTDFASIGGVGKNMQYKYEQNKGVPDATYLINLSNFGVNINWVLLGSLNPEEENNALTSLMALGIDNKELIGIPLYVIKEEGNRNERPELVYFPKSWFIKNQLPSIRLHSVFSKILKTSSKDLRIKTL